MQYVSFDVRQVIYIARNVKDVTVSLFHFYQMITNASYTGTFDDFLGIFDDGTGYTKFC